MSDVSTFGGFSHALLTQLRDEFVKIPTLAFPILSTDVFHKIDIDNVRLLHFTPAPWKHPPVVPEPGHATGSQ